MRVHRLVQLAGALVAVLPLVACDGGSSPKATVTDSVPDRLPAVDVSTVQWPTPVLRTTAAFRMPAGWKASSYGVKRSAQYAVFEAQPTDAHAANQLWIVDMETGALRRVPELGKMATYSASDGWAVAVEKTPTADDSCPDPGDAGCWSWSAVAIELGSGKTVPLATSRASVSQVHVPLATSQNGSFAWAAGDAGSTEIDGWTVGSAAPHPLGRVAQPVSLGIDGGYVYSEASKQLPDGSGSQSTISRVPLAGGELRQVAHYTGPCCAVVRFGEIAYMTGDRGGQGEVHVAPVAGDVDVALASDRPLTSALGLYWLTWVDRERLMVSAVHGDRLFTIGTVNTAGQVVTAQTTAHVVIRADEQGLVSGVIDDAGSGELLYSASAVGSPAETGN